MLNFVPTLTRTVTRLLHESLYLFQEQDTIDSLDLIRISAYATALDHNLEEDHLVLCSHEHVKCNIA
jgi:hypothetical protein